MPSVRTRSIPKSKTPRHFLAAQISANSKQKLGLPSCPPGAAAHGLAAKQSAQAPSSGWDFHPKGTLPAGAPQKPSHGEKLPSLLGEKHKQVSKTKHNLCFCRVPPFALPQKRKEKIPRRVFLFTEIPEIRLLQGPSRRQDRFPNCKPIEKQAALRFQAGISYARSDPALF